ncbi:MAG: hypothetical protein ACKOYQ_04940, partial [Actinomycetota bacterium]
MRAVASAFVTCCCLLGLVASPSYAGIPDAPPAAAEQTTTDPTARGTGAHDDGPWSDVNLRGRKDFPALAVQVAAQLADDSFSVRLAAVSRALAAGGIRVTDGQTIVTAAEAPTGKMSLLVSERADLALAGTVGGIGAEDVAAFLKTGGLI